MALAASLKCGIPTCTLGVNNEQGGPYMTPIHLTTIAQMRVDMQNHMEVHRLMLSMKVREDKVNTG